MDRITWTIEQIRSRFPDRFPAEHANEAPANSVGASASNGRASGAAACPGRAGTSSYGRRALEQECAVLASTPTGGRNDAMNKASFAVAQLVAGGEIDEAEGESCLRAAAESAGLSESEINKTFRSGWEAGKQQPRRAPERSGGSENLPDIPEHFMGRTAAHASPPPPSPHNKPRADTHPIPEEDTDPHRLARTCRIRMEAHAPDSLRCWRESWYVWRDGVYGEQSRADMHCNVTRLVKQQADELAKQKIKAWSEQDKDKRKGDPPRAFPVHQRLVGDVLNALRSITLLSAKFEAPGWITGEPPEPIPADSDFVPCRNGLLAVPRADANAEPTLIPHTQDYFAFAKLSFDYDLSAPEPRAWLTFLASLWPDDPTCISALQEWMGYLLTSDTSAQKILLLIGPPRSGKGTILKVIQSLAGPDHCAGTSLSSLAGPFGLAGLVGKSIAMVTDARLSNKADASVALERLLSVSGEDMVPINRKGRDEITARLHARFVLATNELPKFVDASSAITSRFIVLPFTESFLGREDTRLFAKLSAEFPGILRWALEGLRRFRARGRFEQPEAAREHFADWAEIVSPVGAFVAERCKLGANETVSRKDLYAEWKRWCEETGRHASSLSHFGRDLAAAFGKQVRRHRPRDGEGKQVPYYVGIRLLRAWEFPDSVDESLDSESGNSDRKTEDEMWEAYRNR